MRRLSRTLCTFGHRHSNFGRLCYTGQKGGGTRDWFQNKRVSLGDLKSIEPVLGLPIQDRTQEEPGCTKLTDPLGRKECVYI
ncbi:hypothetical protein CBS11852_497 [Aspergillus niger]|nr:hypothetical protein CBS11852_497 [Aspergillus niger]KAI2956565.1 hypothetical protein CBS147322_2646 [Aspergillus niger]